MLLKKVTLNGFKSFADKTEIPVDPGVTCIVGPNGCGKSNVSDAVRWVLGEQNARHLRGGRMNDLIFAGTAERKQKGMAEVTLHLDNSDGLLPVSYQEVEIVRRVFGSGDSEYLINGEKVRLKDILDLFYDTGIGTDTYSIMEQGKVEQILSAKPLERRQIFEEAAGITKYRVRQDEAVRKLKRTESDLVRIRDIIGELERQVRSLSRQAKRAERFREIHHDLHEKEIALLYLDYHHLAEEQEKLEKELAEAREQLDKIKNQRTAKESMLLGVQNSHSRAVDELRDLKERHYQLQSDVEKREEGIRYHRERLGDFDAAEERLKREIQSSEERKNAETERVASKRNRLGDLEREAERLSSEAAQALEAFREANNAVREKRQQAEQYRNQLLDAENAASLAQNETRQIDREIELQQVQRERLVTEGENAETEMVSLSTDLARIESQLRETDERRQQLAEQIARLEEERKEKEARLEEEQRKASEVRSDLTSKKHRLRFLEDLQSRHEGYQDGTKRVLEGKQNDEEPYRAIHRVFVEMLSVDARYEHAIEAALHNELQYLVCESGEDAVRIIRALRETGDGRASVIPQQYLRAHASGPCQLPADTRGAVRALDVVQYDEENRSAVELLLGDLVITDTLDQALQLFEVHPNGRRYVSLDGEILSSKGVLTGGAGEPAGPLARLQEMGRLQEEIAVLEKRLFDIELIHGQVGEEIAEVRTQLSDARREDHELEVRRAALNKEMDGLKREHQRLNRVKEMLAGEIKTVDEEVEKFRNRRVELEKKLTEAREAVARLEGLFNEAEQALAGLEEKYNESVEHRNALELELLEKKKDLEREKHEIQNVDAQIKDLEELNTNRRRELENLQGRRVASEEAIAKAEAEIRELTASRDTLDADVQRKAEQVATLAQRRKDVEAELHALEEQRDNIKETISQLDNRKVRCDVEQANFERRLREEFSTTLEACQEKEDTIEFRRDKEELRQETEELRDRLNKLGIVNELAIEEYEEVKQRFDFHSSQAEDLEKARKSLLRTISEIKKTTREKFLEVFEQIRLNFHEIFRQMFGGGKADLVIMQEEGEDIMDAGIEIIVQPPGKKLQSIMLLSGGEKACTAIALLFAIYTLKPSPFCLLDEIDAPLDDVNVGRFGNLLGRFTEKSQFIIITHNKQTMSLANSIHGVTMEERGVSSVVSVQFGDTTEGNSPGLRGILHSRRGLEPPADDADAAPPPAREYKVYEETEEEDAAREGTQAVADSPAEESNSEASGTSEEPEEQQDPVGDGEMVATGVGEAEDDEEEEEEE